jgi:hypothetical protein
VIEVIMRQAVISHLDFVSFLPDDIDAAIGVRGAHVSDICRAPMESDQEEEAPRPTRPP